MFGCRCPSTLPSTIPSEVAPLNRSPSQASPGLRDLVLGVEDCKYSHNPISQQQAREPPPLANHMQKSQSLSPFRPPPSPELLNLTLATPAQRS